MSDNREILKSVITFLRGGVEGYLESIYATGVTTNASTLINSLAEKARLIDRRDLLASEELLTTIRDLYLQENVGGRENLMARLTYLLGPILSMDLALEVVRRYKRAHA